MKANGVAALQSRQGQTEAGLNRSPASARLLVPSYSFPLLAPPCSAPPPPPHLLLPLLLLLCRVAQWLSPGPGSMMDSTSALGVVPGLEKRRTNDWQ